MKTYVLMIAKVFPAYHPRKGEPTNFKDLILQGKKIHTIRANYELWKKRFEIIDKGEACLSLRQWEGKPYKSKQVEIQRLFKANGIGLQSAIRCNLNRYIGIKFDNDNLPYTFGYVSQKDGLSSKDMIDWFKPYKPEPMALIHFTGFRYY